MSNTQETPESPAVSRPKPSAETASQNPRSAERPAPERAALARIPDVSSPPDVNEPTVSDGRLLSAGASTKILVSGGISLLLLAVMPFLFQSDNDAPPTPTTHAASSTSPMPSCPMTAGMSKWEGKTAYTMQEEAKSPTGADPGLEIPSPPSAKDQPPVAALTRDIQPPPADRPRSLAPPHASGVATPKYDAPSIPTTNAVMETAGDFPANQSVPGPYPQTQPSPAEANRAMTVHDPANPSRGYGPNVLQAGNQSMNRAFGLGTAPVDQSTANGYPSTNPSTYPSTNRQQADYARRDVPTNATAQTPVYPETQPVLPSTNPQPYPSTESAGNVLTIYPDTGARYYADGYRQQPAGQAYGSGSYPAAPSSPRVADLRAANQPPMATGPAPAEEPGVARFKGIIEKPTFEKGHDYTRPGVY